jgi:hypothetical protein
MSTTPNTPPAPRVPGRMFSPFTRRVFSPRNLRRVLLTLAVLATVTGLFYTVENWRGKRAWERFKQESAARGTVVDWAAYVPSPVPDDQNFFKAPNMQKWFVGRTNSEFWNRVAYEGLDEMMLRSNICAAADVTVVPANAPVAPGDADLVLDYNPPRLTLASPPPASGVRMAPDRQERYMTQGRHLKVSAEVDRQLFKAVKPMEKYFDTNQAAPEVSDVNRIPFGRKPFPPIAPLRVVVRSDAPISTNEIKNFFPAKLVAAGMAGRTATVISTGSNTFRVRLASPPYIPAAVLIEWSDQFAPDFAAIDAALERPYARMEGDYECPATVPIPNFIAGRILAQVLAVRAQCYLLMGEPEKALRELTVIHHMARMFEGRPTSQPMTLVAAMINSAVKGLYVTIIADGLHLRAWQEPQLAALQQQLAETDLMPYLRDAFEMETINFGATVETASSAEIASQWNGGNRMSFWKKASDPVYLFIRIAPHGWLYQNAVVRATAHPQIYGTFDLTNHLVQPDVVDARMREELQLRQHIGPYDFLAYRLVPNFSRAIQSAARTQTFVNEALVACALERYRLARSQYPETLDALVPQFADKLPHNLIGGQPLKYRRDGDDFVLYSVGWNGTDEGGIPGPKGDTQVDMIQNDWVWPPQANNGK